MVSRFQACALVAPPMYPNAIVWSEENLIAVATGHIVTILNPALPCGPRGLITLPAPRRFQIGVIERKELSASGMLPICLSRYTDRPCVRSISWSPIGMAPNSGCLLAVCTIEGEVKIYRSPFLEFQAEWVEVIDVAELLFDNLSKVSFKESYTVNSEVSRKHAPPPSQMLAQDDDLPSRISQRRVRNDDSEPMGEPYKLFKHVELPFASQRVSSDNRNAGIPPFSEESISNVSPTAIITWHNINQNDPKNIPRKPKKQGNAEKEKIGRESRLKSRKAPTGPVISSEEYIYRSSMMSSLIVAWSPLMSLSSGVDIHDRFSLLAVGSKSGKVSFCRVQEPHSYSVDNHDNQITTKFAGFLHAHNAWITAISWVTLDVDPSKDKDFLVTGSAEGSVKIWFQPKSELMSSEDGLLSFNLATEVIAEDCSPVTTLSVVVPAKSLGTALIALGKGSGSFEVWTCDLLLKTIGKIGTCNTHDHVITGLAWAFEGRCLYSCSQDNSIHSWILREGSLCEAVFPSNTPGISCSKNIPNASDSSFGIAISPGNMILATARCFDTMLLDQMYQARCLKGAVEIFWIGGQELEELALDTPFHINLDAYPELSKKELLQWVANMLSSLKHFEDSKQFLVIWDVVAALLAFKFSIPEYVEYFLVRWLATIFSVPNTSSSLNETMALATTRLQSCSCRQLQILNIICRRVALSEVKEEEFINKHDLLPLWIDLLSNIEQEIRERLVQLSLSASSILKPCSSSHGSVSTDIRQQPLGHVQMKQWIVLNDLKRLASESGQLINTSNNSLEKCSFCSSSVAFESPEFANCESECSKLDRCAVSMRVCPATPLWYCVCCKRRALTTAPLKFFKMSGRCPLNLTSSSSLKLSSKPLCPYCGILQQRQLPAFLLSPTPV